MSDSIKKQAGNGARVSPRAWVSLLLVVVTLSVYWQVRGHEFINYDDDLYVTNNRHVLKGITREGVAWAFTGTNVGNWHPITWLSHMIDIELNGLHPGPHHMTNVIFHALNTLILFLALSKMTRHIWPSALVAALFALHPMHVESVAWVAERKDVLSTFFWMLAIYFYAFYAERPNWIGYLPVLLFYVSGLLSKPMVVTFPFVLLLLDYWPLDRFERHGPSETNPEQNSKTRRSFGFLFLEKAPLFLITAIFSFITFYVQKNVGAMQSFDTMTLELRVFNAIVAYVLYIQKMIVPVGLAVFYPHPEAIPIWQVAAALILLILCSALALRHAKSSPYVIVGWLWYIGTLVPVIGLVQVGSQSMADRYTYIPYIGLFICLAWMLKSVAKGEKKWLVTGGVLLSVVVLTFLSYRQIGYWRNSIWLFNHAIEVTQNNYVAYSGLAHAMAEKGYKKSAIINYRKALETAPSFTNAHRKLAAYNLAFLYYETGAFQKAEKYFREVLRLDPDNLHAHNNLGGVLLKMGKTREAVKHFEAALRISPGFRSAVNNLSLAHSILKTSSGSEKLLKK